ncbi:hypothetical protein SAMN04488058_101301 [Deinococcus reticulitermitis]|uniref:Uncharacterized protein n=1 Tax=Deinococcus reticulitermitis TaxID=856736 RepID=A0A1H6SGT4_9DEIO|nr:hypothetical protein [Deinococcus reticulitermitis]SEI67168.1 hypothetical protein SAMN04488058_101301 [Deinococcus reticulitermitis]
MKTRAHGSPDQGITLPLTVPEGAQEGIPMPYGSGGLIVVPVTARVTEADLKNPAKSLPQGLRAGQASCYLVGVQLVLSVPLPDGIPEGGVVAVQEGAFSDPAMGTIVGWKVNGKLALRSSQ